MVGRSTGNIKKRGDGFIFVVTVDIVTAVVTVVVVAYPVVIAKILLLLLSFCWLYVQNPGTAEQVL